MPVEVYTLEEAKILNAQCSASREIGNALKNLHLKLWEEVNASFGYPYIQAEGNRRIAEQELRTVLAKYNPRDVLSHNLEMK